MPIFDGVLALAFDYVQRQPAADVASRTRLCLARPVATSESAARLPGAPGDKYRLLELRRRRAQIRARRFLTESE